MIALTMPMMILNLALLFVLQLAAVQFFFRDRENLLHRFFELVGRFLLGRCRHCAGYSSYGEGSNVSFRNLIVSGSMESITPLTLNFLPSSVRGNRSLPFSGTEIATSGRKEDAEESLKYTTRDPFGISEVDEKLNVQSTGKPMKDFLICSFWDSNISESIFFMIWLGVKLIGSSSDDFARIGLVSGVGVDVGEGGLAGIREGFGVNSGRSVFGAGITSFSDENSDVNRSATVSAAIRKATNSTQTPAIFNL